MVAGTVERHHDVLKEFWEHRFEGDGPGIHIGVDAVQTGHALVEGSGKVGKRHDVRGSDILHTAHFAITQRRCVVQAVVALVGILSYGSSALLLLPLFGLDARYISGFASLISGQP